MSEHDKITSIVRVEQVWRVKMWWRDENAICEAGIDACFPSSWGPLEVIKHAALSRRVVIESCFRVTAERA